VLWEKLKRATFIRPEKIAYHVETLGGRPMEQTIFSFLKTYIPLTTAKKTILSNRAMMLKNAFLVKITDTDKPVK
jgi:hypothetical protein